MKNKHGGSKAKKQKRDASQLERRLVIADEDKGEEYGIITKLLGHCRVLVKLSKNEKVDRLGIICGQMRGRVFIEPNDLVIVSIRDFQDDKVDIVYKYNLGEKKRLKKEDPKVKDLLDGDSSRENTEDIDWLPDDDDDDDDINDKNKEDDMFDIDEDDSNLDIEDI